MQAYIQQELENKNRFIYFRNGRWIVHVIYWLYVYLRGQIKNDEALFSPEGFLLNFLWDNWLITTFYLLYCFYYLPFLFKKNKHIKFWLYVAATAVVLSAVDLLLHAIFDKYLPAKYQDHQHFAWADYQMMLYIYSFNFLYFTTLLFFMELAEGYRMDFAIKQEMFKLAATEKKLVKTQMNPGFIMHSLDGIINLAERKIPTAPDAVIQFADVLRYRLYKSSEKLVSLPEEQAQLNSLVQFHNNINGRDGFCSLETQGSVASKFLPPLSLINIIEPLLNTCVPNTGWNMIVYMLAEETELQVAIEIENLGTEKQAVFTNIQHNLTTIFNNNVVVETEQQHEHFSIRICLPLQPLSVA